MLGETGLTWFAGIPYNKFLANLASDQRKPTGQFAVTPDMGAAWVERLPVSRFHGVGPVTARKMASLGIETGADLRDRSLAFLQRDFGSCRLWKVSESEPRKGSPIRAGFTAVRQCCVEKSEPATDSSRATAAPQLNYDARNSGVTGRTVVRMS